MKYIKSFSAKVLEHNEPVEEKKLTEEQIEELKEFCEISLVNLLDEDFEITIDSTFSGSTGNVSFFLRRKSEFTWNEVKDYFIPFLQRLSNRYEIGDKIKIGASAVDVPDGFSFTSLPYSVKSLINDDNDLSSTSLRVIFIRIGKEK